MSYTAFRHLVSAAMAFLLVGVGMMSFAGCAVFAPQQTVASLCAQITEQNAGVICVKAGYSAVGMPPSWFSGGMRKNGSAYPPRGYPGIA